MKKILPGLAKLGGRTTEISEGDLTHADFSQVELRCISIALSQGELLESRPHQSTYMSIISMGIPLTIAEQISDGLPREKTPSTSGKE